MKKDVFQPRFYRGWVNSRDLFKARVCVKETDLEVLTDKPIDKPYLISRINFYRNSIEKYITRDERFLTTLKPIPVEINAPLIVKEMASKAKKANVGPMAAVAGAIAGFIGKDLLRIGYKEVIIENGGDIFLKCTRPRSINIYAGKSKLSRKFSLKVEPQDTPLGVCASSGTVGHSLSFGCADSVVILSKNPALADAVATAAGNLVGSEKDLDKAIDFIHSIKNVVGAVLIINNNMLAWGKVKLTSKKS